MVFHLCSGLPATGVWLGGVLLPAQCPLPQVLGLPYPAAPTSDGGGSGLFAVVLPGSSPATDTNLSLPAPKLVKEASQHLDSAVIPP